MKVDRFVDSKVLIVDRKLASKSKSIKRIKKFLRG